MRSERPPVVLVVAPLYGVSPAAPQWTMSARRSPFTSAQSSPVLDSALEMNPLAPNESVDAGKTNAEGFVKKPPSGLSAITSTAPLPLLGFGTGELNVRVVEFTKTGVTVVCVGPGLITSFTPGWKLRPVAVYGPATDELFGVMSERMGPGLIVIASWRVAVCSGSSTTWTEKRNVPVCVGPAPRSRMWPKVVIWSPIELRSVSPGTTGSCDQRIGSPPPFEASSSAES